METVMCFGQTEMFECLSFFNEKLNLGYDLEKYRNQYFFWKSDEESYNCFLEVLKDDSFEFEISRKHKTMTRSTTAFYRRTIQEVLEMLNEAIVDESTDDADEACFVCTVHKNAVTLKCCNHELCNKCYFIIKGSGAKCPFCRAAI